MEEEQLSKELRDIIEQRFDLGSPHMFGVLACALKGSYRSEEDFVAGLDFQLRDLQDEIEDMRYELENFHAKNYAKN